MHRKHGRTDTSVALDLCTAAQEQPLRSQLYEYKRLARRWEEFAGPSPLLLLIYSDSLKAVSSVCPPPSPRTLTIDCQRYDYRKKDMKTLKWLATRILADCPAQVVHICNDLVEYAESIIRSKRSSDSGWIQDALACIRLSLLSCNDLVRRAH